MTKPLTEEQRRVSAAALAAHPAMITPDDEGMREVCDSLAERGHLDAVYEGDPAGPDPETDEVVGYIASDELRAAMELKATSN